MYQNEILGRQWMTPTEGEKREWSRMATAAYANDRNDVGHRYSMAATVRIGGQMSLPNFDKLQAGYRTWLIDNKFPTID